MAIPYDDIERRTTEFQSVFDRMNDDMKLYLLEKFVMEGFDGQPVPRIFNVTMNDPALFASRAKGTLQSSIPSPVIISDSLTDKETSKIEEFVEDLFTKVDEMLPLQEIHSLYPFLCEQSCIRGRTSERVLVLEEGGSLHPDIVPLDTGYEVYDRDTKGIAWGAYSLRKSKSYIKDRWGKDIEGKTSAYILDVYDRTNNYAYLKETKEMLGGGEKPHGQTDCPIVYQKVPAGSMLLDVEAMPFDGDSIYGMNRHLYKQLNRLATILHNLTVGSFFAAYQYASEAGEAKETEPLKSGLAMVISVEKGGGYNLIPLNDIRNATRLEYAMLESRLQRGSLPNIDYGNLTFPLSAVAIARLTESKDTIFVPRLQGNALLATQMVKKVIKQVITQGKEIVLGEEGREKTYSPDDLKGVYSIKWRYQVENKEQRLANLTEAEAWEGKGSQDYIMREVLKLANPEGERDKMRDEGDEREDIAIRLYRRCVSQINTGKDIEAKLTKSLLIQVIKQRVAQRSASASQVASAERRGGEPLMPLLGGGGGTGERKGKDTEQRLDEEMEQEEAEARLAETAAKGQTEAQRTRRTEEASFSQKGEI